MARTPRFTDRERQFDCTIFKALKMGEKFRFSSELSGFQAKTGVCVKLTARTYFYQGEDIDTRVLIGSIHAVCIKVDAEGQMIRCGHHTPCLHD